MKKLCKIAVAGAFCLSCALNTSALADFSDISGHWASDTIKTAVADGYISGFEDGTVRPDSAITRAQAVTLICNIMDTSALSDLDIDENLWYANSAKMAVAFGIADYDDNFTADLTRVDAFSMLASTFALVHGDENADILGDYSDVASLAPSEKSAISALLANGYIEGYNGILRPYDSLSRAEFMTVLYRIMNSGAILSDGNVSDFSADTIWLNCSTDDIRLKNVSAKTLVLSSQDIGNISMTNCDIGELVIACDGDIQVNFDVESVIVGSGEGKITVQRPVKNLSILGDTRRVAVGCDVENMSVRSLGAYVTSNSNADIDNISVSGFANYFHLSGDSKTISLLGGENRIDGSGNFAEVTVYAPDCEVTTRAKNVIDSIDYGLSAASIALDMVDIIPAGESMTATATVTGIDTVAKNCTVTWFLDGIATKTETVDIADGTELTYTPEIAYSRDMNISAKISLVLRYTADYGAISEQYAEKTVTLENYTSEYYDSFEVESVLERVTPYYLGDYTLEWAQANDYEDYEKEIWINAKGYTSDTGYLIWINQAYQRVNIFDTTGDKLELIYSCIVGCGRGSNTPIGVFKTTWKQEGWFTSHYDCRPVVRFKYGTGYAFHSRLYVHNSDTEFVDDGIGYPISAGCIRMYDEDVGYIYENIPDNTTVVVY